MRRELPPGKFYQMVDGQYDAIHRGLQRLKPGDRLVAIVEHVDEALEYVQSLTAAADEDHYCTQPVTVESGAALTVREGSGAYAPVGSAPVSSAPAKGRNGRA
jgi:hypothetical protein